MALTEANENVLEDNRTAETLAWVLVGAAKTEHRSAGIVETDGTNYLTLCDKPVSSLSNGSGKTKCKACAKVEEGILSDHDAFWGPINGEEAEVSTEKTAADIEAEVKADVENIIATLETLTKDDAEKIDASEKQAETELMKISANKRAGLRMRLKHAVAEAKERKAGAQLVLKAETTDVTQIAQYKEIVENAADRVAEGIKAEVGAQETAKVVAEAIFDGRLRVINKQGRPDLKGDRKQSKDLAGEIYRRAAEKLIKQGWKTGAVDSDTLFVSLKAKVQYQMTAVLPAFIYSLDNSPEEFAELFPVEAAALESMRAEDPELPTKPSDLIFEIYGVNRKSKAELAADRRAAAKELTSEGSEEKAEEADESESESSEETSSAKTPALKVVDGLGKYVKALDKLVPNVPNLKSAELEALKGVLLALTAVTQKVILALPQDQHGSEATSE
ncbi:hypothetical protein [Streptomyces tsukubensis]|uniref:hypothetical protein n=1 Tax=Streptomyces tsukubensis TaxID=83656 RepID=UPI00344ECA56